MVSASYYESKKRYLLNLYPDIEDGESGNETGERDEWGAPFERETAGSTSHSDDTEQSIGSLSAAHCDHDSSTQRPRRPFWVPNDTTSRPSKKGSKSSKKSKSELRTLDASPAGISPDDLDEDEQERTLRFYLILAGSLLLVCMGIAIVVLSLSYVRKKSPDDSDETDAVRVYETSNIFDAPCDITELESICRLKENKESEVDLSDIPKCVQDNFNLVYVRAGHDAYYQLHSIDSLQSCSSKGMALKKLAAMENEESTSGLLSCQYAAYTWYYEFGEVEWWTEEGALLTGVCDQVDFVCTNDQPSSPPSVEAFVTETGEECLISTLSL
uniref:Uncharacterized protein n=1 Tax=Grammatophora oceanica TaxID=210454 RepID=A0A7S1UNA3_9STRA|mmetsp:Transcript_13826/g.20240  ORF Transcript_13826/g.20240 Transcript_13826/m.20240 type:complete len:328 (+) Transcript_13826:120-1103(+)|eukprot:CAMPEP_0194046648 /NCGR_PEP_ID=MMETSP0009_2-20130614/22078_1 /TAXON_ID=210454 /ORGANISM="Grammatophora oceanica, Strain CCMP 410" /LENGTH=327 /DNA_ID=CAMNT_0038692023 /DNA_START=98 /DNA_END=1081 /DNA_ORIENTATION=+